MEAEAAECRLIAAKFKRKAEEARLAARRAFLLGLERRYILLAELHETEAQKLRAKQVFQTSADGLRHEEAIRCRQLAADAKQMAAEFADQSRRDFYLEIERQWLSLAEAYEELAALEQPRST
jgi:hypothetical protein